MAGVDIEAIAIQRGGKFAADPIGGEFGVAAKGSHDGFKIGCDGLGGSEHACVVGVQTEFCHEALTAGLGQFGHRRLHARDPFFANDHRQQIRVGKITVIVRVFLAAHHACFAAVGVEQHRGLHHAPAVF